MDFFENFVKNLCEFGKNGRHRTRQKPQIITKYPCVPKLTEAKLGGCCGRGMTVYEREWKKFTMCTQKSNNEST